VRQALRCYQYTVRKSSKIVHRGGGRRFIGRQPVQQLLIATGLIQVRDVTSSQLGIVRGWIAGIAPAVHSSSARRKRGNAVVFRLTGPPTDEVLREIRAAQVSWVFRQMPIALAVNAVNAALTAIVMQRLAGVILPFGWLCAVVLVTAGRLALWLRYRCATPSEKDDPRWPLLATGGSLLAGLCWGLGGAGQFCSPSCLP
jgi:hypothetical protein